MVTERCSFVSIAFFNAPISGCKIDETIATLVFSSITSTAIVLELFLVFFSFFNAPTLTTMFFKPTVVASKKVLTRFTFSVLEKLTCS